MQNMQRIVLIVLSCLFVMHSVSCIKCWSCRSDTDPKCSDPFDNSTYQIYDCAHAPNLIHMDGVKPTMCRKIRQKVYGEWRYIRSCAYVGEPGIEGDERYCLMRTSSYNIFMEYCTCNSKDGCNSANQQTASNIWTITFASAFLLIVALLLKV